MLIRAKPIALALQGGGAHGAFAWGLLDRLLEDGRLAPKVFTGASAGAMNAVVAADGLLAGGRKGARESLAAFWMAMADASGAFGAIPSVWESLMKNLGINPSAGFAAFDAALRAASPYDLNPLNLHPLRDIIAQHVDFDRLTRQRRLRVHISATDVRTGRARVFDTHELTPDVLIASACLPALFQAVEIDGAPYWDGGYSANPPLMPLLRPGSPADVVLAPLNPQRCEETPRTADDILRRVTEISFNAPYLAELKTLAVAKRLARGGPIATGLLGRVRRLRLHPIPSDAGLAGLTNFSKHKTDRASLEDLRDRGRETASLWLRSTFARIGKRASLDVEAEFLSDEPGLHR